jgi:hypothetical protein
MCQYSIRHINWLYYFVLKFMDQELDRTQGISDFASADLIKYPSLNRIQKLLESNKKLPKLSDPIELVKFEMLEAELLNQRILPTTNETLSQKIRHEVNLLAWHAKRYGIESEDINYLVDVPRFILKLSAQDSNIGGPDLSYLELFADFILGKFDNANNSYEEGLNVVIKAILKSKDDHLLDKINCNLPISKTEFLKLIKGS